MLYALLDSHIETPIKTWLNENDSWKKNKDVPKPIDDIIDSFFIMEIIKNKYNSYLEE